MSACKVFLVSLRAASNGQQRHARRTVGFAVGLAQLPS